MRRYSIRLMMAGIAAAALVTAATLAQSGTGPDGWRLSARYTARVSFLIFMAAYLAGPVARLWHDRFIAAVLRQRRGIGLAFAGAHTVHLAAFVVFFVLIGSGPGLVGIVFGGLAYVFVFAMAATSNDRSVRALGPRAWGWLHRIGLHYLWFIFTIALLGLSLKAPAGRNVTVERAMLALALFGLALRVAPFLIRRIRPRLNEGALS